MLQLLLLLPSLRRGRHGRR